MIASGLVKRVLAVALASAAAALAAPAPDAAASGVLVAIDRSSTLEPDLRHLCDEIGPRLAGTPQMAAAVDWAAERFGAIGVDSVSVEDFEIPLSWREGATRVEVLSPARFAVEAAATAWSPPTPTRGLDAEVLDAGGGSAGRIVRMGEKARGKILLVRLDEVSSFFDLGLEQRDAIHAIREAGEVGAAAVVFASTRPNRLLYRHIHTVSAELDPVPSAILAREDALRIGRLLDAGDKVRMRISMPNRIGGAVKSRNVIGEIKGADSPEEIVLLGAHLDSWDMGTGCLDNAVNAVLVLEAARAIASSGRHPRRTIRFALFSGEEAGLFGSLAYVRKHRAELDRFSAVVVHDMGLGKISGYALNGRGELEAPLHEAMDGLGARASQHTSDAFFGSDHFDFLLEGVPALVAMQDTGDYTATYHSAADTFDKVSIPELRDRAQVAALTVLGIANLPERLGKRLSREEVGYLLDDAGIDDQMRFLRLWDQWESGARGRE